jgi:FkbM family methyltransferase
MPVTLQSYPHEIFSISEYVDLTQTAIVLDVGANVGQFCITLATMFPATRIYSFEANPDIFGLLQSNIRPFSNITAFNLAIAPEGNLPFYYVPGKSGKGSFIKSNAVINLGNAVAAQVKVASIELSQETCEELQIPLAYDLIKIDVEGFELQVLDALEGIKTGHLFVEFSLRRDCGYEFIELTKRIEQVFGRIKVVFCDEINDKNTMGSLLVECIDFSRKRVAGTGPEDRAHGQPLSSPSLSRSS